MDNDRLVFTVEQLRDAVQAIRNGAPVRNVARDYGIPRTTLRRRLKDPFPNSVGMLHTLFMMLLMMVLGLFHYFQCLWKKLCISVGNLRPKKRKERK